MIFEKMEILKNRRINESYYLLEILSEKIAQNASPGQFVMIRPDNNSTDPLLPRPFSIHFRDEKSFHLLIKEVGKATFLFGKLMKGDTVRVLGPIGNSFLGGDSFPEKAILVGGGVGMAPMKFLLDELMEKHIPNKVSLIIGGRSKDDILDEEFKDFEGVTKIFTTDDGSFGIKGNVINALESIESEDSVIYCCGPDAMMKAVSGFARKRNIKCLVSLETKMACGIGVCLGCVVKTINDSNSCVCADGPVFDSRLLY